jgi:hypothetical protein
LGLTSYFGSRLSQLTQLQYITEWARSHGTPSQHAPKTNLSLHSTSVHSTFSNEVDAETIIRAWYAKVNDVRPHEERLESEGVSPDFRE